MLLVFIGGFLLIGKDGWFKDCHNNKIDKLLHCGAPGCVKKIEYEILKKENEKNNY